MINNQLTRPAYMDSEGCEHEILEVEYQPEDWEYQPRQKSYLEMGDLERAKVAAKAREEAAARVAEQNEEQTEEQKETETARITEIVKKEEYFETVIQHHDGLCVKYSDGHEHKTPLRMIKESCYKMTETTNTKAFKAQLKIWEIKLTEPLNSHWGWCQARKAIRDKFGA